MMARASARSIERYLQRLGLASAGAPDLQNLGRLQNQHLLAAPFENLDVTWGIPIRLNPEALYDKIVKRRRGGFCYELNGLFAWLLRGLGYSVDMLSASVYSQERGEFGPQFDHMALCVHLDRPYLVDVGFGDGFRKPLLLPDGQVEDISGQYRLQTTQPGGKLELQHFENGAWQPQFRFSLHAHEFADFNDMCRYHQSSPRSSFTQGPFCSIAKPEGRITLTENELTLTRDAEKTRQAVRDGEHFKRLLMEYFSIVMPVDHPT